MIDLNLTLSMLELIQSIVKTAYSNATNAERYPLWKLDCPVLSDIDFFVACIVRSFSKVDSGRDFLQYYEQLHGVKICRTSWFTACSSPRRCAMFEAVSPFFQLEIKQHMNSLGNNYLKNLPGVATANIHAYDGHFMRRSVHSVSDNPDEKKEIDGRRYFWHRSQLRFN